jgi:hypothetical protein
MVRTAAGAGKAAAVRIAWGRLLRVGNSPVGRATLTFGSHPATCCCLFSPSAASSAAEFDLSSQRHLEAVLKIWIGLMWSMLYGLTRKLGVMLLRTRGDTAKDIEILVLPSAGGATAPGHPSRPPTSRSGTRTSRNCGRPVVDSSRRIWPCCVSTPADRPGGRRREFRPALTGLS